LICKHQRLITGCLSLSLQILVSFRVFSGQKSP
jgi:hypothetical protein